MNDQKAIGNSLSNIGLVYRVQKDYKNALDYHLQALEIFEERVKKKIVN